MKKKEKATGCTASKMLALASTFMLMLSPTRIGESSKTVTEQARRKQDSRLAAGTTVSTDQDSHTTSKTVAYERYRVHSLEDVGVGHHVHVHALADQDRRVESRPAYTFRFRNFI